MVRRVLMPTVGVVTVGMMTVGVAFAVTGTSAPTPAQASAQASASPFRPATGAGFAPTDLADSTSAFVPSPAVAAAIADAVRTSPLTAAVPANDYEVVNTRIAASDPSWAWTELRPKVADVDRVEAVVHQVDGLWEVAQLGSYEVGCDVAPSQVIDDLDLSCYCDASAAPAYDI
jgi:hypothetical protein